MDIRDLTLKDITDIVIAKGKPAYSAKNIFKWIYKRSVMDFSLMTDISKELRQYFFDNYTVYNPEIVKTQKSKDGCVKFLFRLIDGETIESVLIPKEDRVTVCVSTQVGCKMNCVFCSTATQGFKRDLSPSEIITQVLTVNNYAIKELNYKTDDSKIRAITNIVFMGMGEPLDNIDNVIKTIDILSDHNSIGFGLRKITVSTCGLVPKMMDFKKRCGAKLALSLNASNDETRTKLMPINKTYPIKELVSTIRKLPLKAQEFVTIEYVLFKGLNDSKENAHELAKLLKGLEVKVNLIPYNSGALAKELRSPSLADLSEFYDYLASEGVICNVRHSRGDDISAACGQLKSSK